MGRKERRAGRKEGRKLALIGMGSLRLLLISSVAIFPPVSFELTCSCPKVTCMELIFGHLALAVACLVSRLTRTDLRYGKRASEKGRTPTASNHRYGRQGAAADRGASTVYAAQAGGQALSVSSAGHPSRPRGRDAQRQRRSRQAHSGSSQAPRSAMHSPHRSSRLSRGPGRCSASCPRSA